MFLAPGATPAASQIVLEVEALLALEREQLEALGAEFYAMEEWNRIVLPTARGEILLEVSTLWEHSAIDVQYCVAVSAPDTPLGTFVRIDCDLNEVHWLDVFDGEIATTPRENGLRGGVRDLIDPVGTFERIAEPVRKLRPSLPPE